MRKLSTHLVCNVMIEIYPMFKIGFLNSVRDVFSENRPEWSFYESELGCKRDWNRHQSLMG